MGRRRVIRTVLPKVLPQSGKARKMICTTAVVSVCVLVITACSDATEPGARVDTYNVPKHVAVNTTVSNGEETRQYVVTAIEKKSSKESPWLLYFSSRSEIPEDQLGHIISLSPEPYDASLDGKGFSYTKGVQQVVTRRDGKMVVRRVERGRHRSLSRIKPNLDELNFRDVKNVLEDVFGNECGAELPHALEPAAERDTNGTSTPPAK